MDTNISIDEIRDWIKNKQDLYGWGFAGLARLTDHYSESGLKKAIRKNTLKHEAIIDIVKGKGLENEFNKKFGNIGTSQHNSSIEDVIAQKVIEKLKPLLKERDEKVDKIAKTMTQFIWNLDELKCKIDNKTIRR